MSDELETYIEPELEARLTAFVLGEASAFEREDLQALIEKRPELRARKQRLEDIHGLMHEAYQGDETENWQLSPERRKRVLGKIAGVSSRKPPRSSKSKAQKGRRHRVVRIWERQRFLLTGLAACLVALLTVVALQKLTIVRADHSAMSMAEAEAPEAILARMEKELIEQSDLVQERRNDMSVVMQQSGIPYFEDGESTPLGMTEQSILRSGRQRLAELEVKRGQLETEVRSAVEKGQKSEVAEAPREELALLNQQVDRLSEQVSRKSDDTIDLSLKQNQYNQAREAYEQSREMLVEMEERYAGARAQIQKGERSAASPPPVKKVTQAEINGALALLDKSLPSLEGLSNEKEASAQTRTVQKQVAQEAPAPTARPLSGPVPTPMAERADERDSDKTALGEERESIEEQSEMLQAAREKAGDSMNRELGELHVSGNEWDGKRGIISSTLERNGRDGGLKKNLSSFLNAVDGLEEADFGGEGAGVAGKDAEGVSGARQASASRETDPKPGRPLDESVSRPAGYEGWTYRGGALDGDVPIESEEEDAISPVNRAEIPGIPAAPKRSLRGIVTGGNRSGAAAVTRNSIDGILNESIAGGEMADSEGSDPFASPDEESDQDGDSQLGASALIQQETLRREQMEKKAEEALEYLEDPIRTNPPLTAKEIKGLEEEIQKVDQVRRNLYKGEGYYDLGLYDKATEEFKEVLRTDPDNKAARRWLERTAAIENDYYRAAYDQTRTETLMEVDRAWESEVPPAAKPQQKDTLAQSGDQDGDARAEPVDPEVVPFFGEDFDSTPAQKAANAKLKQTVIPELNFENTSVEDALKVIEARMREGDASTLDEFDGGVELGVEEGRFANGDIQSLGEVVDPGKIKIRDLKLRNVPAETALQYLAEASGLRYRVEDNGKVTFQQLSMDDSSSIIQRKWDVPSTFGTFLSAETREGGPNDDPFAVDPSASPEDGIRPRKPIKEVLQENGVDFPPGSSVSYLKDEGILIVRSTPTQLSLVNEIVKVAGEEDKKKEAEQKKAEKRRREQQNFETSTAEKSDSTFSLNVSDVSFKLAKAALAEGKRPEATRVRPEEFVNAFDYEDERPTQAEKVACRFEQGTHPFMAQRNLMRISLSTASLGRNAATPLRLTLLLDQSGSMERADRAQSVQRAFALLAAQLQANDEVTLVGFARTPRLLAERVKGDAAGQLARIIANPLTEGGTNLEEALRSAFQLAKQQYLEGAQNRIILLTDGAANLGDARPQALADQVKAMRRADIAFDACGVGADGLNDEILSSLTKEGDGRYYFLDRPEDADEGFARQIAGALRPAAENVKVQVLFNPERVSSFKLYGFEKHQLKKEDFRNDTVDAAEMAAEESGVALYHFEPLPEGRGDVGTVSVRFFDTASREMVERTWVIPYEPEVAYFNEADRRLRLAAVAGLFAEKLKGSAVGERVELKRLRQELVPLKSYFGAQKQFEELATMLRQAGE